MWILVFVIELRHICILRKIKQEKGEKKMKTFWILRKFHIVFFSFFIGKETMKKHRENYEKTMTQHQQHKKQLSLFTSQSEKNNKTKLSLSPHWWINKENSVISSLHYHFKKQFFSLKMKTKLCSVVNKVKIEEKLTLKL